MRILDEVLNQCIRFQSVHFSVGTMYNTYGCQRIISYPGDFDTTNTVFIFCDQPVWASHILIEMRSEGIIEIEEMRIYSQLTSENCEWFGAQITEPEFTETAAALGSSS